MSTPKFSVIVPTYNQARFIERTLDSILAQNDPNLELIVIDGGSTDGTPDILRRYERHIAYWVSEKDRGQSHALNKGHERATGDYLTWLNSDDWYLDGALAHMRELFASQPDVGMVVGAGRIVDVDGEVVYSKRPTPEITLETLYDWSSTGNFMQPSSAYTRAAWNAAGPIDEAVHIALDLDLWLRMAKAGVRFARTDHFLSEALSHPDAKTTAFADLMELDCSLIIARHGGEHVIRPRLEKIVARYAWYRRNYEALINHPLLRLLRPLIKRLSREGEYWSDFVPPWVKD